MNLESNGSRSWAGAASRPRRNGRGAVEQPVSWGRRGSSMRKRTLDVAIALTVLTLGFPILCFIAAGIRLESRGPIFFLQQRVGLHFRPFHMVKFRTMVEDAERATGPVWASDRDPRVTRLGAFLRRTHLDEIPQLLNVLRGEMSIVGPRPERPVIVGQLLTSVSGYGKRNVVLPGITGLAQVRSGYDRSIQTVRRKLRYDLRYIRAGGSLRVDVAIMAWTVAGMVGECCRRSEGWRQRQVTAGDSPGAPSGFSPVPRGEIPRPIRKPPDGGRSRGLISFFYAAMDRGEGPDRRLHAGRSDSAR